MRLLPKSARRRRQNLRSLLIDQRLDDLASFKALLAAHPQVVDEAHLRSLALDIRRTGCIEPLTDTRVPPNALEGIDSLREGLFYDGLNSRMRAVLLVAAGLIDEQGLDDPAIYAPEAVTPLAWRLRRRYLRFLGSEFATDEAQANGLYPIPVLDLQALDLRSDAFDLVMANEVLEHVPSIDRALEEIHRVLKPGSWHVGTVPFLFMQHESLVRARVDEGRVVHLMEPEYHVNPMDMERGALVFEMPGWNILDRARSAGFRQAFFRYVLSTDHAVVSEHIGGVLVLQMQK